MAVKIIRQSNKKINFLYLDFYHLIIMSGLAFCYFLFMMFKASKDSIYEVIVSTIIGAFVYYIMFAKFDGENNIIFAIIRKWKYISKKKYIVTEKGEYDLWE